MKVDEDVKQIDTKHNRKHFSHFVRYAERVLGRGGRTRGNLIVSKALVVHLKSIYRLR